MENTGNLLALGFLGACALVGLFVAGACSLNDKPIPEAVVAVVSTCIGGIGVYLSRPKPPGEPGGGVP